MEVPAHRGHCYSLQLYSQNLGLQHQSFFASLCLRYEVAYRFHHRKPHPQMQPDLRYIQHVVNGIRVRQAHWPDPPDRLSISGLWPLKFCNPLCHVFPKVPSNIWRMALTVSPRWLIYATGSWPTNTLWLLVYVVSPSTMQLLLGLYRFSGHPLPQFIAECLTFTGMSTLILRFLSLPIHCTGSFQSCTIMSGHHKQSSRK